MYTVVVTTEGEGGNEDGGRPELGVSVRLGSRGGNDRGIKGTGSNIGFRVTVGRERVGGVLELK